jgi:hypothetical protein
MALIGGGATDCCSGTDATGANITRGAGIAVIAGCSIGSNRVAAGA